MTDTITFEIESTTTTEQVTVPLDFSDFASFEVERVGVLTEGAADPIEVACAFLFVAACRQTDMTDEDYPPFRDSIAPMFSGDTSMVRWEGIDGH